jgi:hypothetical protein
MSMTMRVFILFAPIYRTRFQLSSQQVPSKAEEDALDDD